MKQKVSPYDQINFVELTRKYVEKQTPKDIEGIYTVSASAVKRSKPLFASTERDKTLDQKDNYAMVAIISDHSKNNREFIEIPLDNVKGYSYPIRGEFTSLSEGNVLMLHHFEPKGKVLSYSLVYDKEKKMLEGVRTESSGNATYTYKITFLKVYPKTAPAEQK
ncbi:MAG: hypothetical protein QM734_07010 [Cyclobacteriaceae bacterium]